MTNAQIPAFFTQLIQPLSANDFFDTYWNKKHLHVSRNDADYFNNIIAPTEVNNCLTYSNLTLPAVELLKEGRTAPSLFSKERIRRSYYDGKHINKTQVEDLFQKGHSILINHFSQFSPTLHQAIESLYAFFSADIVEYLVISNSNHDAFRIHHDREHVFAFQISGEKEWSIYDQLAENVRGYKITGELTPPPSDKIVMQPGDCIYVPNSLRHSTRTLGETPSISISIAIDQFYGIQILNNILKYSYVNFPNLTKTLPHPLASEEARTAFYSEMKNTFIKHLQGVDFEQTILEMEMAQNKKAFNPIEAFGRPALTLDDMVARSEEAKPTIQKDGKIIRFKYHHHVLVFYQIYLFSFDFIAKQTEPFKVSDIFGMLRNDMKLDLAQQLIKTGYLRRV